MTIKKIISGGQTGVDQAALQVAFDLGLNHGGWCPPERVCEDGKIPYQFKLIETPQERDISALDIPRSQRTIWNVRDADGVLIFVQSKAQRDILRQAQDPGTKLAIETSMKLGKPYLVIDLNASPDLHEIQNWILEFDIQVLSVGGPSEKTSPGIYRKTYQFLLELLKPM